MIPPLNELISDLMARLFLLALVLVVGQPYSMGAEIESHSFEDRIARMVNPSVRRADKRLARIDRELLSLPELYTGPRGSRFGFHSETIADQDEAHHLQIDLGQSHPIDAIILLPVHLPALGEKGEGYGFPLRFKIELSDNPDNSFQPLAEYTAQDFRNPGRYPVKIPTRGAEGRFVRITSIKHVPAKNGFIWAMEEVIILSGNYNIGTGKSRFATSEQELFPNWSTQRVNDNINRLGIPHTPEPSPTNGFLSAPAASDSIPKWIIVDLGESFPIDEIRIIPTSSEDPEVVGGRGFPKTFVVELSDDPDFETTSWRSSQTRYPLGYPWNSSLVQGCGQKAARYLRVASSSLFARGNLHSLALAEIQVYVAGENVALWKNIRVSDQTDRPDADRWDPKYLVDGYSSSHRLIEIPEFIDLIIERGELERERTDLMLQREEDIELASASVTAGAGTIGGVALFGWIWMIFRLRSVRRRDAERLREQIARDLHDDIGSNLAGIVLISEVGSNNGEASLEIRDDFREIKETAEHTSDAMRDIVWLIHVGNATTRDLFMKMRESVGLIVGHLDTSISAEPPSFRSRPIDLHTRRHFFFAFKEALNNVGRHAQATRVEVLFEVTPNRVTFAVADNGSGFKPDEVDISGHGLENFGRRAERVNGEYTIKSIPEHGTTVRFSAPLNRKHQ